MVGRGSTFNTESTAVVQGHTCTCRHSCFKYRFFLHKTATRRQRHDVSRCHFCISWVKAKPTSRITYESIDQASVHVYALLKQPLVIEHWTCFTSISRFIQPIYGLEVDILGIKDVLGATGMPFIDQ